MSQQISLTKEGYQKLQKELDYLIKVRRPEIIKRIKEAKEYGDLSESAEYENARNEQSFIEGRITEIKQILRDAKIIRNIQDRDKVSLGCKVKVESDGEEFEYTIVGSNEANPLEGRISNESAVGKALLGRKKGDVVKVETPGGEVEYKIKSVC